MGGLASKLLSSEHKSILRNQYLILVKTKETFCLFVFATFSNCGKLLRAFTTTLIWKHIRGTRLIAECDLLRRCTTRKSWASPNGNNVKDWTIRIQASKILNKIMKMVQRLNVNGWNVLTFCLRYSLLPKLNMLKGRVSRTATKFNRKQTLHRKQSNKTNKFLNNKKNY